MVAYHYFTTGYNIYTWSDILPFSGNNRRSVLKKVRITKGSRWNSRSSNSSNCSNHSKISAKDFFVRLISVALSKISFFAGVLTKYFDQNRNSYLLEHLSAGGLEYFISYRFYIKIFFPFAFLKVLTPSAVTLSVKSFLLLLKNILAIVRLAITRPGFS